MFAAVETKLYTLDEYMQLIEIVEDKPFFEYDEGVIYWRYSQQEVPEEILDFIFSPQYSWHKFIQLTLDYNLEMKTKNHSQISTNLHGEIYKQLNENEFNLYVEDPNLKIPNKEKSRVPDVCITPIDEKRDKKGFVENPIVNIEILSPSTKKIDKTEKLEEYRSIPSLQEYIMLDQDQVNIEQHIRKSESTWQVNLLDKKDKHLEIGAANLKIEVEKIYKKVKLKK
jgi:Uma2 family endonuclease